MCLSLATRYNVAVQRSILKQPWHCNPGSCYHAVRVDLGGIVSGRDSLGGIVSGRHSDSLGGKHLKLCPASFVERLSVEGSSGSSRGIDAVLGGIAVGRGIVVN